MYDLDGRTLGMLPNVSQAIHLIRSPYDNLVARFHLDVRHWGREGKDISPYNSTPQGFQAYCLEADSSIRDQLIRSDLLDRILCIHDLIRYVQWHNSAVWFIQHKLESSFVLYYEDYSINYNATVQSLYNFCQQEICGQPLPFQTSKTYDDYYTNDQRDAIATFVQTYALGKTWELLLRYFVSE